jgi:hypothetical protein
MRVWIDDRAVDQNQIDPPQEEGDRLPGDVTPEKASNSTNWQEITLTYCSRRTRGSYKVVGREVTVFSRSETKTAQLGVLPVERLAHMLLRELEFERQDKVTSPDAP